MEDKNKLIELLKDIIEIGRSQNNKLTIDEIKAYLKDLSLEQAQLEPILEYLASNKIKIEGYKNTIPSNFASEKNEELHDSNSDSTSNVDQEGEKDQAKSQKERQQEKEDIEFLKMYLQDLDYISPSSTEEEQKLLSKLLQEEDFVKNRLVEINLKKVVDIAGTFKGQGISVSDLIQEGNISLMGAIDTYKQAIRNNQVSRNNQEVVDFDNYIRDCIRQALSDVINEQIETKNLNKRIIEKVSNLTESLKELSEDLGKKPTIKEAATYLKMSIDEIEDIIRLSKDEDIPIERKHQHQQSHHKHQQPHLKHHNEE